MATTKRFSKVLAFMLALVMIFSLVPIQSFAAVVEVPAANLNLKDGQTVAISKDMNADQVKKALFDALVANSNGADYSDYQWEYYAPCHTTDVGSMNKHMWGDLITGFSEPDWMLFHYDYYPMKDEPDASYKVRIKGNSKEVTVNKVSTAKISFNYDTTMGKVESNGKAVPATANVSPAKDYSFTATPGEGYKIASVKVNGKDLGTSGSYTVLPVAKTNIEVKFAEDGTFFDVNFARTEGITIKLDSRDVTGTTQRVALGRNYKLEFVPAGNVSVYKVRLANEDITSKVTFKNYVGTYNASFAGPADVKVEAVNVNNELVLNSKLEAGYAIKADGSPDWAAIRQNFVDGFIDNEKSALLLTPANTEFQEWKQLRLAGGGYGAWAWVRLEGEDKELGTYFEASRPGNHLKFHVRFLGNDQFRPTDFVEFYGNVKDVQTANIVLKKNPTVTINETSVGVFDYSTLKQDIFNAAVDSKASVPNLTLDNVTLVIPENITTSGNYKVTVKYLGSTSYKKAEKTFDVTVHVENLPKANIVLNKDSVDLVLKETKVGVYDNAALKEAAFSALVNTAECTKNGLDVSKIKMDLQDINTNGTYTVKFSYAATDALHANEVTATVNVTVDKCPTAGLAIGTVNAATLYKNYNGSWNYDDLKDQIFALLTVTGVENLTREDVNFQYLLLDAMNSTTGADTGYQNFEFEKSGWDKGNTYHYLHKGGEFQIKVIVPATENYYGSESVFTINIATADNNTAQIIANDGQPYLLNLNKNKDGSWNYADLKQKLFEAAVKEVKNVKDELVYTDFNYQYNLLNGIGTTLGDTGYKDFSVEIVSADPEGTYRYLWKGGEFEFKIILPTKENVYHGTEIVVKANISPVDPFKSNIVNKLNPVLTLKETSIGVFDVEALKKDIYNNAIDFAASTPNNVKFEELEIVVPEITKSGKYTITVKFLGNDNYNASSVSFEAQVDVTSLPKANIVLNKDTVDLVLKETKVGVYDNAKLKADAFAALINKEACEQNGLVVENIKMELADVTANGTYTVKFSYAATDKLHANEVTAKVNVTVDKCPTAGLAIGEKNSATLYKNYNGSWNYDDLKDQIFALLTVTGVENLTREDVNFQYFLRRGGTVFVGQDEYYPFEQTQLGADITGSGIYLDRPGKFQIKVIVPATESYYGSESVFTIDIATADNFTAQIIANEGQPYALTLNKNKDGSWNYTELKQKLFEAAVKEVKNVNKELAWDNFNYQYNLKDAMGTWTGSETGYQDFSVEFVGADALSTYKYLYKGGEIEFKIILPGEKDVYNGTEILVNANVATADPFKSTIVLNKEIPAVTLTETTVGTFDKEALKKEIFDKAINFAATVPAQLNYSECKVVLPENINESKPYSVTVKFNGNNDYNESSVTFDVQINVNKLPAANIVLNKDTVDLVLKETKVGVYDNAALKEAAFSALVNTAECEKNGLDVSKIKMELQDITTDGTYTVKFTYAATDKLHEGLATAKVNVTVDKCPTVALAIGEKNSATLNLNYDRSYNYEELKDEIFGLLTVSGVEGLTRENFVFKYQILNGLGVDDSMIPGGLSGHYYDFEQPWFDWDKGGTYRYLYKGGEFKVKISIPTTETYYGTEAIFTVNVSIEDNFTSEIIANEGQPYNLTLNKNKDGSYNYTELKKALYEAAVKEVKNVKGDFAYTDFNYQYNLKDAMGTWTGAETGYKDFSVEIVGADAASTYKYLWKGGEIEFKIILPEVKGSYYGTEIVVKANVAVEDPFKSTVKAKADIPALTLTETTVGVFDVEALKHEIYDKALDLAGSTPNNIKFEELEFTIPEITKTGDYTVTVKFLGNFDYNESSVSFNIHVDVNLLPAANIVLKQTAVSAEITETEIGRFNTEALKMSVFEQAVDAKASSPELTYNDVEITFNGDVTKGGKFYATIKFKGTDMIHENSVSLNVDVTVNALPTVVIDSQHRRVTLNKKLDGSWDYDGLKNEIFNACLKVTGVEGLTYDKFKYEYDIVDAMGSHTGLDTGYHEFEFKTGWDNEDTYRYIWEGGSDFKIKVSIPDSATYHGASVEFTVDVDLNDPYYTAIVTKPNYEKNFVLNYNAEGNFDYDRLKKEIFDAVIDVEKNNDKTTFENMVFKYQILNATGVDDSHLPGGLSGHYYDFEQPWLGCDLGGTYRYLYKGGNFNVKLIIPESETARRSEVIVNVNVTPAVREASNVVLKDLTVPYSKDVNDIKQAIFNSIDIVASKIPQDVTVDDFKYEYYTINYTAGDLPGVEHWWVPVEGMKHPTLLGSYFKQIQTGTYAVRVTYRGNEVYKDSTSKEATINVTGRDFTISFTDNDIYLDETLPATYIKPSIDDNFTKFEIFAYLDGKTDTTIYIDTAAGLNKELAFAGNVPFNNVLLKIFGIETILSADEVYYRRGLSRAELETLVAHPAFVEYMQYYHNVNAVTCEKIAAEVKALPANIQHIWFQIGQPSKPGTYRAMGIAALENYNSAFATQEFYIRFHKRGTKLIWWQSTSSLNVFTAKSFDFRAVLTKNGLPINSDHVKYIYTGFRANGRFYASTKNPPREAGIYTQTAYTGIKGRYAFPKTRTFIIGLS